MNHGNGLSTHVRLVAVAPNPSYPPLSNPLYKSTISSFGRRRSTGESRKNNPPFLFTFPRIKALFPLRELANPQEALAETESTDQRVVRALYQALRSRDVFTVHKILAPDLEWWFHGPPSHQFLMRLLTGANSPSSSSSSQKGFSFEPEVITSFGPIVLVEGCDRRRSIYWVHAWTVADGIITQVREYFNTSLTVTKIGGHSELSASEITKAHCIPLWESSLSVRAGKSVPGLVLTI